jgi:hypothetical protein
MLGTTGRVPVVVDKPHMLYTAGCNMARIIDLHHQLLIISTAVQTSAAATAIAGTSGKS